MTERIMKYIVVAGFVLIAVVLFFAPAWSAGGDGEEVVASMAGAEATTGFTVDWPFLGLGLLLVLAGTAVVFSQNRRGEG